MCHLLSDEPGGGGGAGGGDANHRAPACGPAGHQGTDSCLTHQSEDIWRLKPWLLAPIKRHQRLSVLISQFRMPCNKHVLSCKLFKGTVSWDGKSQFIIFWPHLWLVFKFSEVFLQYFFKITYYFPVNADKVALNMFAACFCQLLHNIGGVKFTNVNWRLLAASVC